MKSAQRWIHLLWISFAVFSSPKLSFSQTKPSRIISNTLLSDEILYALISDYGDKDLEQRVLYFSEKSRDKKFSNIAQKTLKPAVDANLESILNNKPDLVILASFNRIEFKHALKSQKIPILELDSFDSIDSILQNIKKISLATKSEEAANKLEKAIIEHMSKIRSRADAFHKKRAPLTKNPPTILSVDSYGYSMGQGTLWDDLVNLIGFTNWASSQNLKAWPKLQDEALLKAKFNYLVLSSSTDPNLSWDVQYNLWKEFFKKSPWPWILKRNELQPLSKHIFFAPEPLMYSCSHYALDLADFLLDSFSKIEVMGENTNNKPTTIKGN